MHPFKKTSRHSKRHSEPFFTSVTLTGSSGQSLTSVNNEIKVPFSNPWVGTVIPGHWESAAPLTAPTAVNPSGGPLSPLTLDDIATAMARRGQREGQRGGRSLSEDR